MKTFLESFRKLLPQADFELDDPFLDVTLGDRHVCIEKRGDLYGISYGRDVAYGEGPMHVFSELAVTEAATRFLSGKPDGVEPVLPDLPDVVGFDLDVWCDIPVSPPPRRLELPFVKAGRIRLVRYELVSDPPAASGRWGGTLLSQQLVERGRHFTHIMRFREGSLTIHFREIHVK